MERIANGSKWVEASDGFRRVVVLKVVRETASQVVCAELDGRRDRRFVKKSGSEVKGYLGRGWAWTAKPEQVAAAEMAEAARAAMPKAEP